jgi:hypothetical protein
LKLALARTISPRSGRAPNVNTAAKESKPIRLTDLPFDLLCWRCARKNKNHLLPV